MTARCLTFSLLSLALAAGGPVLRARTDPAPSNAGTRNAKQPPMVVESLRKCLDFQVDGTGVQDYTGVFHVLQESAVKNLAVLVFGYSNGSETIDIDYVRVKKPNGSVVVTPPGNIQDVSAAVTIQAPIYSDLREKHVAVKSLSVGDTLEIHLQRHIKKNLIPGEIWTSVEVPTSDVVKEQIDQISLPASKAYRVVCHGKDPEMRIEGGRRILRWRLSNLEILEPPARAPWAGRPAASIQLTTFQSWQSLGDWYRKLQEPQTQATPAVQKQAKELTQGLKTDRERIKALYEFVATKIHYLGLSFGIGCYRPHSAEEVLANGYGDCKDKHTLLAGLMRAVGLEAWPAIIRSTGDIDPEVPSPSQFDHLITVVPCGGDWLWLDTTPEIGPFGYLSVNLRGKPALVIPRTGPAVLKNTPEALPFPQESLYTFKGKLQPGGKIEGHCEISLRGDNELMFRQVFRQAPPNRWPEFLSQTVSPMGTGYEFASIESSIPENTEIPFTFNWDLKRQDTTDWEKKRALVPLLPFGIENLTKMNPKPNDPVFLPLSGLNVTYRATLELPAGSHPALPAPCNLSGPIGEYHASYSFKGGVFLVERRLKMRGGAIVDKERDALKAFCDGIANDEDQYVLLNSTDLETASENPEASRWFKKGAEALQRQDFATAREAFRKTIERSPRFPGVHMRYGITFLAKGDFQTGIRELLKEESFHPESPAAYQILGEIYQSHGNKSAAIEQWKSAVEHDPDNRAFQETLFKLLQEERRYEEAVHHLEKALKRDPENAEDTLWLAEAYAHTGRTRQAVSLANKAVTLCETPEFMARAARLLVDMEQPLDQAKAWNDKAGPLLDAQSLAIGDDDQKGLSNTSALSMVWETKGRILLQEGHPEAALPFLKSAWSLSLSGSCGDLLAQAYARLGRKEDAARQYELANVATGADRDGIARRYWKLTGNAMPDRRDRSTKSSSQLIALTYKLIELRTGHFPNATSFGTLNAVVVVTPQGTEQVHLGKRSDELGEYIEAAKSLRLHIEFPDATPRKIYLQGGMEFKRTGGTFIFVVP